MRGVNKVILVGTLGADPDVKTTQNGVAIANLSLATSESWQDQQGNKQERTEWHRIVLYRRLAEIAGQYLKKGGKVYIEGKLQTRKWQDQQGNDRYTTEILGDSLQMLGDKSSNAQANNGYQNNNLQANVPQPQYNNQANVAHAQTQQQPQQYQQQQPQGGVDFDDDIPF